MRTLLLILAAGAALILVAGMRPVLGRVLWAALGVLIRELDVARHAVGAVRRLLLRGTRSTRSALAYQPPGSSLQPAAAWDVIAPVVFAILAVLIVLGDAVLAALRMGSLLGLPMDGLPVPGLVVDVLAGLLFLAVLATFGLLLLDVLHVTPTVRPFGLAAPKGQRVLKAMAWAGTTLSIVAGMIFLIWGQGAVQGAPSDDLATLFVAVFAVLLVVASIVSIAGALGFPLVVWLALQLALTSVAVLLGWALNALGALVEGVHEFVQAALRLVAWPGERAWNWLSSRGFARKAGLTSMPLAAPLPPLGSAWPDDAAPRGHAPRALPAAP